ncbi:MAG: hypothetical protein MUF50_04910 [Planctomycetes bacterium]|nr:hypothetical protein [Planctomycetota bacterium]
MLWRAAPQTALAPPTYAPFVPSDRGLTPGFLAGAPCIAPGLLAGTPCTGPVSAGGPLGPGSADAAAFVNE